MQKQYKTGVKISFYDQETKNGRWAFPKPKEGYVSNGYYSRGVIDEQGNKIEDLEIKRYKDKNGEKPTVSLLPSELIPYQLYPVPLITQSLYFWLIKRLSIDEVFNKLCLIFSKTILDTERSLYNFSGAQLYHFKKTFKKALVKYLVWQKMARSYSLEQFLIECSMNNYQQACVLSDNYNKGHSGRFLFGLPFQSRGKPH